MFVSIGQEGGVESVRDSVGLLGCLIGSRM